jgi:hypothetical protein
MIERHFNIPFVAGLALREKQIQQNYRPVIAVHKWFARRPGTLFRALILSEFSGRPVIETFYQSHHMPELRVFDPFMGGGTTMMEANRIGCSVIGADVNPMAWWIVRQELLDLDVNAYTKTADQLLGLELSCRWIAAVKNQRIREALATNLSDLLRYQNEGLPGIRNLTAMGAPYAMLLYERFLGRPFAGHRDSVSDLIGDNLESAIEEMLAIDGISFRKTRRAERLAGFDQAPDFIIPDEFSPRVIIEAKITEDDGTARDKVTRILRLCQMAEDRTVKGMPGYQVNQQLRTSDFLPRPPSRRS